MSTDVLQAKIKKQNNALIIDFTLRPDQLPAHLVHSQSYLEAYRQFGDELLRGLKGEAVGVRFRLSHFAILGNAGLTLLAELTKISSSLGFYTLMDCFGISDPDEAAFAAAQIWGEKSEICCDGIITSAYYGTDIIKAMLPYTENSKKDIFAVVRTPNKSASELQDLFAGSRTVHVAAADYVNRCAASPVGKFGFSRVGIAVSATSGDSVKMLRAKYPKLFMLVDGMDAPGANAKNCSYGFDSLGHGAVACLGVSVTCAWKESGVSENYVQEAVQAVRRAQNKLSRYITIM